MATESTSSTASGDASHSSILSSKFNQFRKQGIFCDVIIIIENRRFRVHKAVLSASSRYFMSMFTSGFQETERSEVKIEEGSAESFEQLVEFAYTGYFELSADNVCGILRMANYMEFTRAIDVCVNFIINEYNGMNLEDVFEIYCMADAPFAVLVDVLRKYLLNNFVKLGEVRSFLDHASHDFVAMCLSSEEIEIGASKEEEQVC